MKLVHHPEWFDSLRPISSTEPLRILVSGCMAGWGCGIDGTDYGMGRALADFNALTTTQFFAFCPEDIGLGTPRTMPDLHHGDGHAVLNGTALVLDENGQDLSEGMIRGANAMVAFAIQNKVELCLLTDMSGACGTQVISDGCRFDEPRKYQQGQGVAAAALMQAGFMVLSNRDYRTLQRLRAVLEPGFVPDPGAQDHHETEWVREYFGNN